MLLAVAQMTASDDVEENIKTCERLIKSASERGALLVSLPECFAFIGSKKEDLLGFMRGLDDELVVRYRALAKKYSIWVSYGGLQERASDVCSTNAHLLVDDSGKLVQVYRKLHLFDVDIPGGPRLFESDSAKGGDELVVVDSPLGKLGMSICYDLRFAEQYIAYRKMGAEVMLVPAAFTATTGKAHWEVLLRARAIETQSYVAAAAQYGKHNHKRHSHGDAMIIDPWGQVIARCGEGEGIAVAEVNADYLKSVRQRMPVMNHRRSDVY